MMTMKVSFHLAIQSNVDLVIKPAIDWFFIVIDYVILLHTSRFQNTKICNGVRCKDSWKVYNNYLFWRITGNRWDNTKIVSHSNQFNIFVFLEFAKNHLPLVSPDPIGKLIKQTQLDKSDIEIWGLQYKEPEPSWFFQISQDTLLCTTSSTMSSEDFYLFAQTVSHNLWCCTCFVLWDCNFSVNCIKVINSFKSSITVLILTVLASSNFKSDDHPTDMESPLWRTLATTHYSYTDLVKDTRLEQPNILGGVAAGSIDL